MSRKVSILVLAVLLTVVPAFAQKIALSTSNLVP
jgi:hypothetical protein